jgi:hypothetical protein
VDTLDDLILDLLEWLSPGPRQYSEVLDAWLTSCRRLPDWESAVDRGFDARHHSPELGRAVSLTDSGTEYLQRSGRGPTSQSLLGSVIG